MEQWIAWLAAIVSFSAFLVLWFREVRRMLRSLKSIVDSALEQAAACRRSAAADERAAGVLARSESILRQAVENYNHALTRPWNFLPGHLMGFHRL